VDSEFWKERWEKNQIGFHLDEVNEMLEEHFKSLKLEQNTKIFLPLCGKTLDIQWLLSQGYNIIGAELSELAIQQLFDELNIKPDVSTHSDFKVYQAKNLKIYVGDIFNLTYKILGSIDAVYDRAALVALPFTLREKYTAHLRELTNEVPQLLLNFTYDQSLMNGPPFSVSGDEIKEHYSANYKIDLLESKEVEGKFKGKVYAQEMAWLLKKKTS